MALIDEYRARTPRSAELFERATASIPGGSTRTTVFNPPYPPYMAPGEGLRTWDVDGNEYRDFLGNYTSLILGHAHPAVVDGGHGPGPARLGLRRPDRGRDRAGRGDPATPAVGREAAVHELRHRGDDVRDPCRPGVHRPDLVARFDGAYHGTHDTVLPGTPGVPDAVSGLVIDLPWGDPDGIERALAGRERSKLAAVIIEPVQGAGGVRPAGSRHSSRSLREMTSEIGAVLIFDEIIAFRIGPNGAQGVFGVTPDLTTLGKIIGGGYRAGGVRRPGRDHGPLRRPAARARSATAGRSTATPLPRQPASRRCGS